MKKFASILLIYVIVFLTCFSSPAQTPTRFDEEQKPPSVSNDNLKEIFAKQMRKTKESVFTKADIEKLEKESVKQTMKRSNFSAKQKTWLWIGIGTAVGVTILILAARGRDDERDGREGRVCIAIFPPPPGCQ